MFKEIIKEIQDYLSVTGGPHAKMPTTDNIATFEVVSVYRLAMFWHYNQAMVCQELADHVEHIANIAMLGLEYHQILKYSMHPEEYYPYVTNNLDFFDTEPSLRTLRHAIENLMHYPDFGESMGQARCHELQAIIDLAMFRLLQISNMEIGGHLDFEAVILAIAKQRNTTFFSNFAAAQYKIAEHYMSQHMEMHPETANLEAYLHYQDKGEGLDVVRYWGETVKDNGDGRPAILMRPKTGAIYGPPKYYQIRGAKVNNRKLYALVELDGLTAHLIPGPSTKPLKLWK